MNQDRLNEPITVFSDLHIAHPLSMLSNPEQIEDLLPQKGTVIFNGDTVEMRSEKDREEGVLNRKKLIAMCEKRGIKPVFLTGNHDPYVSEKHYSMLHEGEILITHGDFLFHGVSPWSHESQMIAEEHTRLLATLSATEMHDFSIRMQTMKTASRILEKYYVARRSFSAVIKNIIREFIPPWRPFSVLWYWHQAPGRAVKIAEEFCPQARFILIGHMHRAGIWKRDGRVIINTGCFFPFVGRYFLRIEDGCLSVCHIQKQGNRFVSGTEKCQFLLKNF